MAELLIFNRKHWMDDWDEKQLAEYVQKYPKFMFKYNVRQQKGDVVDVKDDGHWTGPGRGYDKESFDVVIVKGKTAEELKYLREPLTEPQMIPIYKNEFEIAKWVNSPKMVRKFSHNISSYKDKDEIALTSVSKKVLNG